MALLELHQRSNSLSWLWHTEDNQPSISKHHARALSWSSVCRAPSAHCFEHSSWLRGHRERPSNGGLANQVPQMGVKPKVCPYLPVAFHSNHQSSTPHVCTWDHLLGSQKSWCLEEVPGPWPHLSPGLRASARLLAQVVRSVLVRTPVLENICSLVAKLDLSLKTDRRCWTNAGVSPKSLHKSASHGSGPARAHAREKPMKRWVSPRLRAPGWELAREGGWRRR